MRHQPSSLIRRATLAQRALDRFRVSRDQDMAHAASKACGTIEALKLEILELQARNDRLSSQLKEAVLTGGEVAA